MSIHEKGVTPQVEVVMSADEDSKLSVQLSRSEISAPEDFKEHFGFDAVEDRQLRTAIEILRGVEVLDTRAGVPSR